MAECRILKKESPVWTADMSQDKYEFARQYFIDTGIIFSHNGGKSFNHTVHILRAQCTAWAEFARGKTTTHEVGNSWRETELAQRELDKLNKLWDA